MTWGPFLAGAATCGFVVSGMFFLRFWVRTRESLFAAFGISFFLLAANQALITLAHIPVEYQSWAYLLKVAAFGLLILAVVRKNLGRGE